MLTLQPRTNRFSERLHAEGLLHGVVPAHAAASGKALLAFSSPGVIDRVIAAGLPAFTSHTITSPDVLRRKLSVIRLTQVATSRNEFECGKAAIAMPIFYGGGRVAAGALSVACHSLSRQLATELRMREAATPARPRAPKHPQYPTQVGAQATGTDENQPFATVQVVLPRPGGGAEVTTNPT